MVVAKKAAKSTPTKLPKKNCSYPRGSQHDFCSCSPVEQKAVRSTRSEMFVGILEIVKKRSTCSRSQVSALIAKENRIISMGYGGSPSGLPHCLDEGCIMGPNGGCIRTIHAECNAIAFSARHGISIEGADLWTSLSPCIDCAKLIINSGVTSVYYLEEYRNTEGIKLLIAAGIKVFQYENGKTKHIS